MPYAPYIPGAIGAALILVLFLIARHQPARNLAVLMIMAIAVTAAFFTFSYGEQKKAIVALETRFDAAGLDVARYGGLEPRARRYIDSLLASDRPPPVAPAGTDSLTEALAALRGAYALLMDSLAHEIARQELEVGLDGETIRVQLMADVTFGSGMAILSARGEQTLRRAKSGLIEALNRLPGHIIRVEGHTDTEPLSTEMYFDDYTRYALDFTNWELSALRAVSAVRFLHEELLLPPERLQAAGWSEYQPQATNRTRAGRARNRRIDVIVAPADDRPTSPPR